jgi:hypothetical protein
MCLPDAAIESKQINILRSNITNKASETRYEINPNPYNSFPIKLSSPVFHNKMHLHMKHVPLRLIEAVSDL